MEGNFLVQCVICCLEDFPMLACKGVLERLGSWQQSLLSVLDPKSPSPSRDMGYIHIPVVAGGGL